MEQKTQGALGALGLIVNRCTKRVMNLDGAYLAPTKSAFRLASIISS